MCWVLLVPMVPTGCELTSDGDCRCDEIADYEAVDLSKAYVLGSDAQPSSDTVPVPDISIRISFELEAVSRTASLMPRGSWLATQALACTCVGPFVRTQVADISIVSASPVSEEIAAGTELIDLFDTDFGRLEDGSFAIDLHPILRQAGDDSVEGVLLLRAEDLAAWTDRVPHVFTMKLTMSDGKAFEQILKPIRLIKG